MSDKKDLLNKLILKGEWPGMNSITYNSGKITMLDISFPAKQEYVIEPFIDADIYSYLEYNPDDLIPFDIFSSIKHREFEINVGDTSVEGGGVVYVINNLSQKLVWFAFFEDSEYFKTVTVNQDDEICAVSANDITWKIPINDPTKIELTYPK